MASNGETKGEGLAQASLPISACIYGLLREEIVTLVRPPGSPLSDKEVSNRFGISRTPVRESFIRLAEEGMIVVMPQAGTFVTKIRHDMLRNAQFLRRAIECAAIEDVPRRPKAADIAALRAIVREQEGEIGGAARSSFYRLDEAFHRALFELSGHSEAWSAVEKAKVQLDRARYLSLSVERRMREVVAEHTIIIDALAAGAPEAARRRLDEHLTAAFGNIESAMAVYAGYFERSASATNDVHSGPARPRARTARSERAN